MLISTVQVKNFRSINPHGIEMNINSISAFVGRNSSGKSSILLALDYFFNASTCELSDFWYEHTDTPIDILVTFHLEESEKNTQVLMHSKDGNTIVCKKTMKFGDNKAKCLIVGQWRYTGKDALNPYPDRKPTVTKIQSYLQDDITEELRLINGWHCDTIVDVDAYMKAVQQYWSDKFSEMPKMWNPEAIVENKEIIKLFPPYFYLPVEYTVTDEMKLTKASRFQLIYNHIIGDIDALLSDTKMADVQDGLRKIYKRHGIEKRLHDVNKLLQDIDITASDTPIRIALNEPDYSVLFKRSPEIMVDDGFDSAIQNKGHGMQRDVIFRLLQAYLSLYKGKNSPFIIAVDEPELYMHPAYKRALYSSFLDFADRGCQVLYTTHDPAFVSVNRFDDIHIVRRDKSEAFYTKVQHYSMQELRKTQYIQKSFSKRLSQMKDETIRRELAHKCHGNQNEGFFADRVIIVEGDTEQYALPIYFRRLGFDLDKTNTVIVSAGSVTQVGLLFTIFSAFEIPCYCIFDADKPHENKYQLFLKNRRGDRLSKAEKEILNPVLKDFKVRCGIIEAITGETLSDYPDTTVSDNYTVWEHDFESTIHNAIPDIETIKGKIARDGIDGKPLRAYHIAIKVLKKPDLLPETIWSIWRDMISKIKNMQSIPLRMIEEEANDSIIQIIDDPCEGSLPVFSSAAGRDTYFTEDMVINYATGIFPADADCLIHIQGTSMEPVIPNGSYVAARYYHDSPVGGHTYICCINDGEMVCKQYIEMGTNGEYGKILKSLNPEEEDISIDEEMAVRFQCVVLCKDHGNKQPYCYSGIN